jgi:hypothetical protein
MILRPSRSHGLEGPSGIEDRTGVSRPAEPVALYLFCT